MEEELSAREAVREMFALYADHVYRYARLTLGNHEDAKDAVQEIFFKAFKSYRNFRGDANVKTWLLSIARNHTTDILRKRKTERDYLATYQEPFIKDESTAALNIMELEHFIHRLKPAYQAAVVMRYVEELTNDEVAAILGWSQAKVRQTVHRAIVQLRQMMNEPTDKAGEC